MSFAYYDRDSASRKQKTGRWSCCWPQRTARSSATTHPNELRDQIEERMEVIEDALNKALDRPERNKVVRLRPKR